MEIRSTLYFNNPIDYISLNYDIITYYIDNYFRDNETLRDNFKIFNQYKKSDVIHTFASYIRNSGVKYLYLRDMVGLLNLNRVNRNLLYIKMLKVFEDGNSYHYEDVWNHVLKPKCIKYGNDIDTYNTLIDKNMIVFDHHGSRRKKYYRITEFGKYILNISDINEDAYRIIRHFDKDPDLQREKIMNEDLMGIGESWNDLTEDSLIKMISSVFTGNIYKIKSNYYWINKIVNCYKKVEDFRILFTENIRTYMNNIAKSNTEMSRFIELLNKIDRKLKKQVA
jgi:hypothetical protein